MYLFVHEPRQVQNRFFLRLGPENDQLSAARASNEKQTNHLSTNVAVKRRVSHQTGRALQRQQIKGLCLGHVQASYVWPRVDGVVVSCSRRRRRHSIESRALTSVARARVGPAQIRFWHLAKSSENATKRPSPATRGQCAWCARPIARARFRHMCVCRATRAHATRLSFSFRWARHLTHKRRVSRETVSVCVSRHAGVTGRSGRVQCKAQRRVESRHGEPGLGQESAQIESGQLTSGARVSLSRPTDRPTERGTARRASSNATRALSAELSDARATF